MDGITGIILAGGKGSRFRDPNKCLKPVCGVPMILRVAAALQPFVSRLAVATTRAHGPTAWLAELWGFEIVYTDGLGYEHDIAQLLDYSPAVIAACDMPFLTPAHVAKLLSRPAMTSVVGAGGYVGLTWLPRRDTSSWTDLIMPELRDVDAREDWLSLSDCDEPTYPLIVESKTLKPHEDVEMDLELGPKVRPLVVDAWTCSVLDGHHRLKALLNRGTPAPVVPMDYSRIDVTDGSGREISKLEVIAAASLGVKLGVRATRHYYRGVHVSMLRHVEVDADYLDRVKPLRCNPL